jgi:Ca-activated chloride channel family protein
LFVTDGIPAADFRPLEKLLTQHPLKLSILGIGTEAGAPIPLTQGGFLKNSQGEVIVAGLNGDEMAAWAQGIGARYQTSSYSDGDIERLLPADTADKALNDLNALDTEQQFDSWLDAGPWLILGILPLALLAFRRGWLLGLCATALMLPAADSFALSWRDLWQTDDQQGQQLLEQDQPEQAAEAFADEQWRGVARYRAGDYDAAAEAFANEDSSTGHYNRGNALAQTGKLEAALAAYQRALELDPDNADAASNKLQVEEALRQQKQQQQSGQDGESGDQGDQEQNPKQADGNNRDGDDSEEASPGQGEEASPDQGEQASPEEGEEASPDQGEQTSPEEAQQAPADPPSDQDESPQQQDGSEHQPAGNYQDPSGEDQQTGSEGEATAAEQRTTEEDERLQQWLRQIPDEPGELLQRKFNYQYRQQQNRGGGNSTGERY